MDPKSSANKRQRQIGYLVTCPICLEYFVDPRLLSCSHTYCHRCIVQIAASSGGQFECSMRDGTIIRANQIDSLPVNRAVQDMVDLLPNIVDTNSRSAGTTQHQCDRNPLHSAAFWCQDCNAGYCTPCWIDVHKGHTLSEHRRVPIEEKVPKPKRCDLHHDERIKYLCSCGAPICRDCERSKTHEGHKSKLIREVVPSIIGKLKDGFEKAQSFSDQRITNAASLKSGSESASTKSITRIFGELHKMLDEWEKILEIQILEIDDENTALVNLYLEGLDNNQATLSGHITDFEQILSTKDDLKVLEAKDGLANHLEKITRELRELEPPIKTDYRIDGVNQLQADVTKVLQKLRVVKLSSGNRLELSCLIKNESVTYQFTGGSNSV